MGKRKMQLCFILCLMLSLCFISSCDTGLQIVGIQIVSYPDRLVYIKDVDTEINLTGGVFRVDLKEGSSHSYKMNEENRGVGVGISKKEDFSKEGVYKVSIGCLNIEDSFPIQVLSLEDYGITQDDIGPGGFLDD